MRINRICMLCDVEHYIDGHPKKKKCWAHITISSPSSASQCPIAFDQNAFSLILRIISTI